MDNRDVNINGNLEKMKHYGQMDRSFMNKSFNHPNDVVGNYEWHEAFPYEQELVIPVIHCLNPGNKNIAIDFGCGPGRMINRMYKTGLFERIDGIDVSDFVLDYARSSIPNSNFYSSNGYDVGDAPANTYDLVYSTIAIQHIACRSIRNNIFSGFKNILKDNGSISLQFAFHPTMSAGVWSHNTVHVHYLSDAFDAKATNGQADFILNLESLQHFMNDLNVYFKNISFKFFRVDDKYSNLNGRYHDPYWASHWLFVSGQKKE